MISKPRAVLLDLDGTLLDTLGDIAIALGRALVSQGLRPLPREVVATMVGDGARALVSRALAGSPNAPTVEVVLADFLSAYAADPTPETRLMPGAAALLDALAERSVPAVVCTNKPGPLAREIVARTLGGRIGATLGGGDTARLKPDPEPLVVALARVGVDPADAWMVGDGPQDIAAARAASVTAIGYRGGYGNTEGADLQIDALDELVRFL